MTRRILQIIHGDEVGGVKTLADTLGDAFTAGGYAVDTACLFPPPPAGAFGKLAGMARVSRMIVSGRYEAVIAYQSTACLVAGVVGRLARCPRRIAHQTALPGEVRPALRWLDRMAGSLGFYTVNVFNSRATGAAFSLYPAPYRRAMTLIEHGVVRPLPGRSRAATLAGFSIPDDGPVLLNIGRLAAQKNHAVLIRALARLPSGRLVVAGDGPLRAELEALAAALGVLDRLHLLGAVDRQGVADLLGASDVFVFPSTWETFGLAAVEAALAGLPIVASDLDVLREVLTDSGVAVRFAPQADVDAWAEALRSTVRDLPAERPPAAGAGRYTMARMIEGYGVLLSDHGTGRAESRRPAVDRRHHREESR